jgi:hypothetical protein
MGAIEIVGANPYDRGIGIGPHHALLADEGRQLANAGDAIAEQALPTPRGFAGRRAQSTDLGLSG